MGIPLNPAYTNNAAVANLPGYAIPMNLANEPTEGVKCVPFQLNFSSAPSWLIDLSQAQANPNPLLSQLCCMYVDAGACEFDVTIAFPDSGFSVTVGAGDVLLFPVLTSKQLPRFYVSLGGTIASAAISTVNIFCINKFIPEFNNSLITKTSNFYNSMPYPRLASMDAPVGIAQFVIIPFNNWQLNTLVIQAVISISAVATVVLNLYDGATIIGQAITITQTDTFPFTFFNIENLNYKSLGSNNLSFGLDVSSDLAKITNIAYAVTCFAVNLT